MITYNTSPTAIVDSTLPPHFENGPAARLARFRELSTIADDATIVETANPALNYIFINGQQLFETDHARDRWNLDSAQTCGQLERLMQIAPNTKYSHLPLIVNDGQLAIFDPIGLGGRIIKERDKCFSNCSLFIKLPVDNLQINTGHDDVYFLEIEPYTTLGPNGQIGYNARPVNIHRMSKVDYEKLAQMDMFTDFGPLDADLEREIVYEIEQSKREQQDALRASWQRLYDGIYKVLRPVQSSANVYYKLDGVTQVGQFGYHLVQDTDGMTYLTCSQSGSETPQQLLAIEVNEHGEFTITIQDPAQLVLIDPSGLDGKYPEIWPKLIAILPQAQVSPDQLLALEITTRNKQTMGRDEWFEPITIDARTISQTDYEQLQREMGI